MLGSLCPTLATKLPSDWSSHARRRRRSGAVPGALAKLRQRSALTGAPSPPTDSGSADDDATVRTELAPPLAEPAPVIAALKPTTRPSSAAIRRLIRPDVVRVPTSFIGFSRGALTKPDAKKHIDAPGSASERTTFAARAASRHNAW